jgi:hypothetical protein
MLKRVTELAMVFAKRLRRADMHGPVGKFFENDIELSKPDRTQRCSCRSRDL